MQYLLLIIFYGFFPFSQEDRYDLKINSGLGQLKINTELKTIKDFIKPLEKDKMWIPYEENDYFTYSPYLVDMAKFPAKKFYGLVTERIEIRFQTHFNEEGSEDGQDIYEFNLFIPWPSASVYNKLLSTAEKEMGPVRSYSIDESSIGSDEEIESPNWFTSKTLLTIAGKKAFKIINGKKYLWVKYKQAYGG
jgi:hypothetical protein